MATCIFTIASANYIAFAATLMQSVRRFHPQAARFIVLADEPRSFGDLDLAAEVIACDDLGIALISNMKLWYAIREFNTALKPFAFRHMFRDRQYASAIYLDPDVRLYAPLDEAIEELRTHSLVLTPHITRPLQDGKRPSDISILQAGVYNLGFVAIVNDEDGRHLVEWWCDRLYAHCRDDVANNLFTDQRWMDLAPAFVEKSSILRSPAYNVAYWNVGHRTIEENADGVLFSDGRPLVFFHFSGIDPGDPAVFSKHQDRFAAGTLGAVTTLCDAYRAEVLANGWQDFKDADYAYAIFGDGRPIIDAMRRWLRRAIDDGRLSTDRALRLGSTYFDAADATQFAAGGRLTRFADQLWRDRPDLQREFDLHDEEGFHGYVAWFTRGAAQREGIPPRLIEAAAALRDGTSPASQPRPLPPPWPSLAEDAWRSPARDAALWVAGEVRFDVDGVETRLQRQIALLWERRIDLQHAFPLRTWWEVEGLLAWALTDGMREGAIDGDLFTTEYVRWLDAPCGVAREFADVPITHSMMLTRRSEHVREGLETWRRFPAEPTARLEQGFWHTFLAPVAFGWPAAMTASGRRFFDEATGVELNGYAFSRGMLALHEMRPDVRKAFDLGSDFGKWGYLCWLLAEGTRQYPLAAKDLCPGLKEFMSGPWPLHPSLDNLTRFAHTQRDDLKHAFDLDTEIDRLRLTHWVHNELIHWLDDLNLKWLIGASSAPSMSDAPRNQHRCFLALSGNWMATSGVGEDLRSAVAALEACGFHDYVIVDLPSRAVIQADRVPLPFGTLIRAEWNIVYRNADTALDDWRALRRAGVEAERVVAHWLWELQQLPPRWRHAFSFCDEVWASSRFVQAIFAAEGHRPVRLIHSAVVAPHPVSASARRRFKLAEDSTLFLFLFDFASYAERKNPSAVIHTFASAFPRGDERACLMIKTQNASLRPDLWDELVASTDDPRVVLRDACLPREDVIGLIDCADAFVSLHRSEGFGRGPAEAMLLGVPVILTGYSGPNDFTDGDCACVVGYTLVDVQPGAYPEAQGQRWAEPNVEEAAGYMRWVHEEPHAAKAMGLRGKRRVEEMLGPSAIGREMLALLDVVRTADPHSPSVTDVGDLNNIGDAEASLEGAGPRRHIL